MFLLPVSANAVAWIVSAVRNNNPADIVMTMQHDGDHVGGDQVCSGGWQHLMTVSQWSQKPDMGHVSHVGAGYQSSISVSHVTSHKIWVYTNCLYCVRVRGNQGRLKGRCFCQSTGLTKSSLLLLCHIQIRSTNTCFWVSHIWVLDKQAATCTLCPHKSQHLVTRKPQGCSSQLDKKQWSNKALAYPELQGGGLD